MTFACQSNAAMISVENAIQIIRDHISPLGTERLAILDSIGSILAEPVIADHDLPPFDRSTMDGYAVIAADTKKCPADLRIVGESAAGRGWHETLKRGQAIRIMTGAPVPPGADAVQKLELAAETNGNVSIQEPVKVGQNIVKRGSEVVQGRVLIDAGERITSGNVGVLAAFGYASPKVAERPRVAIFATGSEIVAVDRQPGIDQIRDTNTLMLAAMCSAIGANVAVHFTIGDDLDELCSVFSEASIHADLIITTGGVSVGKYDLTKTALQKLGAEIYFDRIELKPGKPTVFARFGERYFFGLPGNPVSAAVTFHLFVREMILGMQKAVANGLRAGTAVLTADVRATKQRATYLPGILSTDRSGILSVTPTQYVGSSDLAGFSRADCLIVLQKSTAAAKGTPANILFLPRA